MGPDEISALFAPPPVSYELHPAVASLIVRMSTALEREGIGPYAPTSGYRAAPPDADIKIERLPIPPAKFPTGDNEPTDTDVIRQAFIALGLDPDLDYDS